MGDGHVTCKECGHVPEDDEVAGINADDTEGWVCNECGTYQSFEESFG